MIESLSKPSTIFTVVSCMALALNFWCTWRGWRFYKRARQAYCDTIAYAHAVENERNTLRKAFNWLGSSIPPEYHIHE